MSKKFSITPEQRRHIKELISASGNALHEDTLIEAARKDTSPLHDLFDWSDKRCALVYRRQVAARILRSCGKIKVFQAAGDVDESRTIVTDSYIKVSASCDEPKLWRPLNIVLKDADLEARAMGEMIDRLRSWHTQLLKFPKLQPLYESLSKVVDDFKIEGESAQEVAE